MKISNVVYCDANKRRVNATLSDVLDPDSGQLLELKLEEVDIEMDAPYPALIRKWLAAGNVPVPLSVTPRQARLALFGAGLLEQVEAAVDAAGGQTKITWEYATEINRNDPLIQTLGFALGLSDKQIDALFVQAAEID